MRVDVVQVPWDSGHHDRRMGAGPGRVLDAGLLEALAAGGSDARVIHLELDTDFPTEIDMAFRIARAVEARVAEAVAGRRFPIILAGNCIAALGAVAALGQPVVFWFDAHADLNTPETTRSGFLDGMALSILMGRCWRALAARSGVRPVAEERVHLIGARDLDPAEEEFLASSSVHVWEGSSPPDVGGPDGRETCYVHVDLDVLDPEVGRANRYSAPGGLRLDQLLDIIGRIAERNRIGALALTAYDPAGDAGGRIATAAVRIAAAVAAEAAEDARGRGAGDVTPGR